MNLFSYDTLITDSTEKIKFVTEKCYCQNIEVYFCKVIKCFRDENIMIYLNKHSKEGRYVHYLTNKLTLFLFKVFLKRNTNHF
jgi:protein associated with RNAse G/E